MKKGRNSGGQRTLLPKSNSTRVMVVALACLIILASYSIIASVRAKNSATEFVKKYQPIDQRQYRSNR